MSMFDNENFETLELMADEIVESFAIEGEFISWDDAFNLARERLMNP